MRRMYSEKQLVELQKEVLAEGNIPEIKADSIIENMSGYKFNDLEPTGFTINFVYAGACKNGNKLTLVVFMTITRTSGTFTNDICSFEVPKNVGSKLFPDSSLGIGIISLWQAQAYSNVYTKVDLDLRMTKTESTNYDTLQITGSGLGSLTLDTLYNLRIEQTFLLSENLAE